MLQVPSRSSLNDCLMWLWLQLGYWLTAMGVTRALHMVVILPRESNLPLRCSCTYHLANLKNTQVVTRILKPRSPAVALPVQPNELEPLLNRSRDTSPEATTSSTAAAAAFTTTTTGARPPTTAVSSHAVARSDLLIARVSLLIDIASYVVVVASAGPKLFVVGSLALSFGGGFGPAASSLAMHLSGGQETGKLFGAMAVANTIGFVFFPPLASCACGLTYFLLF